MYEIKSNYIHMEQTYVFVCHVKLFKYSFLFIASDENINVEFQIELNIIVFRKKHFPLKYHCLFTIHYIIFEHLTFRSCGQRLNQMYVQIVVIQVMSNHLSIAQLARVICS